ncbi:uncharacterized protein LOC114076527 [Solanum pennellii]|uniref:Uncharacterized protein LOC114076527 n=1 Tax=Solanum pennellii TaxID=28526 RepID=A0ABM1V6U1_SOLPN|nr:uncharacterized protein LOC114076527 [Solanum pennellii]
MSETNAKNRKKLMNPHSTGKKCFALVRNNLEKDKETVSSKDLFVVTRIRKPGRFYKASNKDTTSKLYQMQERMQKMGKQMKEKKKIMRQVVIAVVIEQLKHEGLIDPNVLAPLSTPSPRESTSVQRDEQANKIEEDDESSSEDFT